MQSGIERETAGELPFPATYVGGDGVEASSDAELKFERVKTQLKARLGAEVYSSWFARMKVAEASRGIVRISVPTAFLRSWINGHYLELIAELWRHEDPDLLKIEIVVRTATRQGRNHVEPEVARVTLTFPTLASCREMLFEVSGSNKHAILARVFDGEDLPAARACSLGDTVWLVDAAACPGSSHDA